MYRLFSSARRRSGPLSSNGAAPPGGALESTDEERVRYQRLRLLLTGAAFRSDSVRSLMVAGCRAGTGASTTAVVLARTLAEGNRHRVLLIDANLHRPRLDALCDISNETGLCDALVHGDDLDPPIHETRWSNLWLLTAGHAPAPSEALFEDKRLGQLLTRLKHRFDFIVLDSAPVLESAEPHGLAPEVDGVILVIEAGRTPVHDAQQAKRDLELAGGRLIGAILNRERDYTPRILRRFYR
jgi:capsular exopolysaccharide synthesis family protein